MLVATGKRSEAIAERRYENERKLNHKVKMGV
jgi:hypothetical protein